MKRFYNIAYIIFIVVMLFSFLYSVKVSYDRHQLNSKYAELNKRYEQVIEQEERWLEEVDRIMEIVRK